MSDRDLLINKLLLEVGGLVSKRLKEIYGNKKIGFSFHLFPANESESFHISNIIEKDLAIVLGDFSEDILRKTQGEENKGLFFVNHEGNA